MSMPSAGTSAARHGGHRHTRAVHGTVTFGAVGDVGFQGGIGDALLAHGTGWPFARVREALARADLLFGNMESVSVPPGFPQDQRDPRGLISPAPAALCAASLRAAGFDFMNLAANHVLDAGTTGMFHTREALEAAGLATGGIGRTQAAARRLRVIARHGIRFGFLCYCEDNNYALGATGASHAYYRLESVLADVRRCRAACDVLVVSIHADIEFMETPSAPRRANARRIAAAGAGIILMHHPHVPQGIEMHRGCLIAYSLGNFLFNAHTSSYMRSHGPRTAHSYVLLMDVTKRGVRSFERVPVVIGEPPEERPAPAAGTVRRQLLAYFARLDAMLQDDDRVRRNWRSAVRTYVQIQMAAIGRMKHQEELTRDLLPRLLFVAENRSVMDELAAMLKEEWALFQKGDNCYHRPLYRLQNRARQKVVH